MFLLDPTLPLQIHKLKGQSNSPSFCGPPWPGNISQLDIPLFLFLYSDYTAPLILQIPFVLISSSSFFTKTKNILSAHKRNVILFFYCLAFYRLNTEILTIASSYTPLPQGYVTVILLCYLCKSQRQFQTTDKLIIMFYQFRFYWCIVYQCCTCITSIYHVWLHIIKW